MQNETIVEMILVVVGIIFILLEIVLNLNNAPNDTTNEILLDYTKAKGLFIPFAIGAICGHLFLGTTHNPLPSTIFNLPSEILVVVGIFICALIIGLIGRKVKLRTKTFLTVLLLLGLSYGHFFWSMNYENEGNQTPEFSLQK